MTSGHNVPIKVFVIGCLWITSASSILHLSHPFARAVSLCIDGYLTFSYRSFLQSTTCICIHAARYDRLVSKWRICGIVDLLCGPRSHMVIFIAYYCRVLGFISSLDSVIFGGITDFIYGNSFVWLGILLSAIQISQSCSLRIAHGHGGPLDPESLTPQHKEISHIITLLERINAAPGRTFRLLKALFTEKLKGD